MLNSVLNQRATYQAPQGKDKRGVAVYGDAITLPCRKQSKYQFVMLSTGDAKSGEYVYYLVHAVEEGGLLDGRRILRVMTMTGLDGIAVGYKAVT